jgi:hypothetical protein
MLDKRANIRREMKRPYKDWQSERPFNEAWVDLVNQAMPPYERQRVRDADEARLLRERGTASRLIGPTRRVRVS